MSEVAINYKNSSIATMDASGTKTLLTSGKYCDADIAIVYTRPESGGEPNLQAKTYTVDSAGTETITADSGYDGLSSVAVSVPQADPWVETCDASFYTEGGGRYWKIDPRVVVDVGEGDAEGWIPDSYSKKGESYECSAVPANTVITPSSTAQTVGGANYMMEGAVTVAAMPTGTAGTPTATKGTVSNHQVSVTPSVTNITGYITGSTKTGTAVTVSASELVSGDLSITENGANIDVANYATATVAVSASTKTNTTTKKNTDATATSLSFTGLLGQPKMFSVRLTNQLTRSSSYSYYYITEIISNTATTKGNYWRMSSGAFYNDTTHYSYTYSNGTLTVSSSADRSSSGGSFYNGTYELLYIYLG